MFSKNNLHFNPAQTPQPPTLPQPSAPSVQLQRPFSHFMNVVSRLLNFHSNNDDTGRSNGGGNGDGNGECDGDDSSNDGDDEEDNESDHSPFVSVSPGAESPTSPSPATEHNSPTASGPITRSQTKEWITQVTFLATTSTHSPSTKRKRASSVDLPFSTTTTSPLSTKGDRASKRIRNSSSDSLPLPDSQELKRTRGLQKKFEAKLGKDHVFDPQCPGSVRRESADVKSGPKGWRRESLHGELWDGSKE